MEERPVVFLSGARNDLESCREVLDIALSSIDCICVWQDDSNQNTEEFSNLAREKMVACDAVLHLVGEYFGSHPNDQNFTKYPRSYSQLEYYIALELKKPLRVFLCTADFPYDMHHPESDGFRILQQKHRYIVTSNGALCVTIADKQQLVLTVRNLAREFQRVSEQVLYAAKPKRANSPAEHHRLDVSHVRDKRLPADRIPIICAPEPTPTLAVPAAENVQFTAYRPKVIYPGKWTKMLVFAHLDERPDWLDEGECDPIEEMAAQAAQILGPTIEHYRNSTEDSRFAIPREGEITLVPEIHGIDFNPPRRSFFWKEGISVHYETFNLRATPEVGGQTLRGGLTIFLGHLILAEINLSIRVDSQGERLGSPVDSSVSRERSSARPFRHIFASYSHQDTEIVEATERYARTLGDIYLRDWMHLRSGEVWSDRLQQMVRAADIFQLFWSSNSARSKFVESEWRYALGLNRPAFVRPTYWQEPMPPPPEELKPIHFHRLGLGFPNFQGLSAVPPRKITDEELAEAELPDQRKPLSRSQPLFTPGTASPPSFMPKVDPELLEEMQEHRYAQRRRTSGPQISWPLSLLMLGAVVLLLLLINRCSAP